MNDQTEEKSLPASQKKLRDARRKGQVSHSRDLVTGFTLTLLFVYLLIAWPTLSDRVTDLVNIVSQSIDRPFAEAANRAIRLSIDVLLLMSLPLAGIVAAGDFIAGTASTFGPVFSFDTVTPKLDHINPAQGLKRIFSIRNVVELAKAVVKIAVLATAFMAILRGAIEPLFETPVCGYPCVVAATLGVIKPLVATAAAAFMAIGLIDLLVQRQLFLREMRMTRTEFKREAKDLDGDPLVRREQRRLRRQLASGAVRVGIRNAVIAVMHGNQIVGLRYKPNETQVPVVVCKGQGEAGAAMLAEARQLGLPIIDDAAFVSTLAARHQVGDRLRPQFFDKVARMLVGAGFS
jgi:type III secretion protein U